MNTSKYLPKLKEVSARGDLSKKHAAVVIYKGQPVAWGFNSITGGHASHAEFSAIRSFLLGRGLIGWVRSYRGLWGSHRRFEKRSQQYSSAIK